MKLIDIAKEAGTDAVKFQLIPPFQHGWEQILKDYCDQVGIEFMATPFNQTGIDALKGKVKHWKIASPEAGDPDFVDAVIKAADGDPVFISDGAVDKLPVNWANASNVIRMACVVKYPAEELDYHFLSGRWGLSDHTEGTSLAPLAVAAGATVVEKHFTDDKKRDGPDHAFALEPGQLTYLVNKIRHVEKIFSNEKLTIKEPERKLEW